MTTKNTYNPEDIESLLMTKVYDDLLPAEKDFVMQHLDSKDEYALLRTTLLAIKKSSDNDELIEANPKTKEELLLLMNSKSRRGAGWFNLNGLWSFLFPSDVFFVKKPGFQLASFAMLLIFGFYFSGKFLNLETNNLAINKPSTIVPETVINQEPDAIKGKNNITPNNIAELKEDILNDKVEDSKLIEPLINDVVAEEEDEYEEVSQIDDLSSDFNDGKFIETEQMSKKNTIIESDSPERFEQEVMSNISTTSAGYAPDNELLDYSSDEVAVEKSAPNTRAAKSRVTSLEGVAVSSSKDADIISRKSNKRELNSLQSQSLSDDESIIDLLYITL